MNKTIYIPDDSKTLNLWYKAQRYLRFFEDKSIGKFVMEKLQEVVTKYDKQIKGE